MSMRDQLNMINRFAQGGHLALAVHQLKGLASLTDTRVQAPIIHSEQIGALISQQLAKNPGDWKHIARLTATIEDKTQPYFKVHQDGSFSNLTPADVLTYVKEWESDYFNRSLAVQQREWLASIQKHYHYNEALEQLAYLCQQYELPHMDGFVTVQQLPSEQVSSLRQEGYPSPKTPRLFKDELQMNWFMAEDGVIRNVTHEELVDLTKQVQASMMSLAHFAKEQPKTKACA